MTSKYFPLQNRVLSTNKNIRCPLNSQCQVKLVVVISPLNTTSLTPVFNKMNQNQEVKSTFLKVVTIVPLISTLLHTLRRGSWEGMDSNESWTARSGPGCFWEEGGDHAKAPRETAPSRGRQRWITNHACPHLAAPPFSHCSPPCRPVGSRSSCVSGG